MHHDHIRPDNYLDYYIGRNLQDADNRSIDNYPILNLIFKVKSTFCQVMSYLRKIYSKVSRSGILLSILVILILIVVNGFVMSRSISQLAKNKEYRSDIRTIKNDFDGMLNNIQITDLAMRGYFIVPEAQLLNPLGDAKTGHKRVFESLEMLFAKYELDEAGLANMKSKFNDYLQLDADLIEEISNGNTASVVEVIKTDPGYELWKEYRAFRDPIIEQLDTKLESATAEFDNIMRDTIILQIILFLIGLPTLVLIIRKIRRNDKMRKEYFKSISKSNKKFIYNNNKDEILTENEIINNLVGNLKEARSYINNITNGDYEVEWTGMTSDLRPFNENNLAGELIKMKHKMIEVKKEDEIRMWTTEGLAKFAEIVRSDFQDLTEMCDSITSNIVKYLNANQGGLFLVMEDEDNNNEIFIELKGCYAYDRKRFVDKKILPGQGLIGQTFKEGTTLYLKEIPDNYVNITSGLGESTPSTLLIVPLIVNENIVGLIEVASFEEYKPQQIEFVEKVGEIIASSLNAIKTNEKTKKILEISQEQAEQMQAQEEEMRQNMEELEATHEEMRRNEQRMTDLLTEAEEKQNKFKEKEEDLLAEIEKLKKSSSIVTKEKSTTSATKKSSSGDVSSSEVENAEIIDSSSKKEDNS